MKKVLNTFLLIILSKYSICQTCQITSNPTLNYLYNTKNEIPKISNTEKLSLFPIQIGKKQAKFKLIKNENGLFALVDGSGQVYKATLLDKGKISFTRIDSTYYFGNTFMSINFSYKNIIYSFGGYGFWNLNGQLSHFTPGAEWTIDKINKTYNTLNTFYSYQLSELKLYYIEIPRMDEATFDRKEENYIISFDLDKKVNKVLGKLNPKINTNWEYFVIDIPSLHGTISYSEPDIYLYNFSANKVYKLINSKIKDELIGKAGAELQTTFEDEGKLYYSFNNDPSLRTVTISINDFKEEPYPIYYSENNENYRLITILIICLLTFTILTIVYKKRKRKFTLETKGKYEPDRIAFNSNEFNTIESTLINKLIEKSNLESHLTVDEINSLLGIKKKTIEIQKRVRTEAIIRINHKFNVNFNLETTFIERKRSIEDRRYFNYIIIKENAKIFLKHSK